MNIIFFGDKMINLDLVQQVSFHEDEREEGQEKYTWLKKRFYFYYSDREEAPYTVVYDGEAGFDKFELWFLKKESGVIYDY